MSLSVVWVTGWGLDMPWVGIDTRVCPYLDGGRGDGCLGEAAVGRTTTFDFPIDIQAYYPRNNYLTRWTFNQATEDGGQEQKLCFLTKLRIV